jgi:hypothetical protein
MRYINPTEQCRQIPVALVLVMEQDHIHEILTNLTSSLLRFQITQIQLNHVRNVQSQLAAPPAPGQNPPHVGVAPPPPQPGGRGRGRGPRGGPGGAPMPRPAPGVVGQPQQTGGADADPNLVELCIYGVASLYEKYYEEKPAAPPPGGPKGPNPPGPGGLPKPPAPAGPGPAKQP